MGSLRFFYVFCKILKKFSVVFLSWSLDRGCEPSYTITKKIKGKPLFFQDFFKICRKFEDYPTREKCLIIFYVIRKHFAHYLFCKSPHCHSAAILLGWRQLCRPRGPATLGRGVFHCVCTVRNVGMVFWRIPSYTIPDFSFLK